MAGEYDFLKMQFGEVPTDPSNQGAPPLLAKPDNLAATLTTKSAMKILKDKGIKGVKAKDIKPFAEDALNTLKNNPEIASDPRTIESIMKRMDELSSSNAATERAGISEYQNAMNEYKLQPQNIDFTPIAGLIDRWAGDSSGSLAKAAAAHTGESLADRQKNMLALKERLQNMTVGAGKNEYQNLKDQLDSLMADARAKEAARLAGIRGSGTDERFFKRQLVDYGKQVKPLMAMNNAFRKIEDALGFNINEFDSKSGTVRGERTDAPGINVPILGRINQATPQSRQFKSKLAALTNMVLKERSGASVTTQEQARIMDEFANGRLKFNTEADMLSALKDFARGIEADIEDTGSMFDPEIPSLYDKNQSQRRQVFERESGVQTSAKKPAIAPAKKEPTDADIDNMTEEQLKAYLGQ